MRLAKAMLFRPERTEPVAPIEKFTKKPIAQRREPSINANDDGLGAEDGMN